MAQNETACVVGSGMRVHGTLRGQGDVEVRGRIDGVLALEHNLWVAAGGEVEAETAAHVATVDGRLRGRLRMAGGMDVRAGGDVAGELHTPSFSLSPDGQFDGHLQMPVTLPPELGGG